MPAPDAALITRPIEESRRCLEFEPTAIETYSTGSAGRYDPGVPSRVRVAGVVAALSVTNDLTRGHPVGEAMRSCLVATELARRSGLSAPRRSEVFYSTLMRFAGCAATSHEAAANFGGDDIAVRAKGDLTDTAGGPHAVDPQAP